MPLEVAEGCFVSPPRHPGPTRAQKLLFLARPRLIVQPSIYKYVNKSSSRHTTARLVYTEKERRGSERSPQLSPPHPPPPKTVFLDGFNEYRMFIVTIPCDSHKRLEKSTSILPPLPILLPLSSPIPQSITKEEEGVKKKKEKKERKANLW